MQTLFSLLYRLIRRLTIGLTRCVHLSTWRRHHLELAISIGDTLLSILRPFLGWLWTAKIPAENQVRVYSLTFPTPLTFSSFKYHESTTRFWLDLGLGGGALKTILKDPRTGNKKPRIQEFKHGLINAMGLPGPGIKAFCEEVPGWKIWHQNKPIGISIGGNSIQEYVQNLKACYDVLSKNQLGPRYFELNISCPNTPEGQQITEDPELLRDLLQQIRAFTDDVISVKVSPDQSNDRLLEIGEICKSQDQIMINCGNTQFKRCEALGLSPKAISIGGGGMSGELCFERTCEMIRLFKPLGLPIMATGGISTPEHVNKALDLGADLIGMATALVKDPFRISKLNQTIANRNRH